jgi:alpha-beta hydrolase superfamily lysophospholipase
MRINRWSLIGMTLLASALFVGCVAWDKKQGEWIFQPSDSSWRGGQDNITGMADVWIEFDSSLSGQRTKLHGLWIAADVTRVANAPVLLYLHGARWNVNGSAHRIRRMQELGFSVLAVDYRGFGKSDASRVAEDYAYEDAHAAWNWLADHNPNQSRYIFGHSLGGAIAIELASRVTDESGTIVEGTFTSIPDVVNTMKWGWLPVNRLITQRFESINRVSHIGSPLLVVHGENDQLIKPELGRKLFDAARAPKEFVLVKGGSHHNTNAIGAEQYREALARIFELNSTKIQPRRLAKLGLTITP